ncbi:MAG: T9SS type A sorting domain-containing protein [Cytophagales bacterium]
MKFLYIITLLFALCLQSINAQVSTTVSNLFANNSGFTLFNLEENKIIPNEDSASNKWHLGFRGTSIIINSLSSGPGNVLAKVVNEDFNSLLTPPNSGFAGDTSSNKRAIIGASGASWYDYLPQCAHVIKPIPNRTIILKVDENFYKIRIISYYKDAPELPDCPTASTPNARYYTFDFQKLEGVNSINNHLSKLNSNVNVFPNPVSGDELFLSSAKAGSTIEIYNTSGVLIKNTTLDNDKFSISDLPKGLYILRVIHETQGVQSVSFVRN